ncbi:MAG: DUF1593 domain-containing protein [Planctomycetales bacterium]|nr:DUF1593 domain-containing protein [Planctomycetales bacterium]
MLVMQKLLQVQTVLVALMWHPTITSAQVLSENESRPRLLVLTDIGGDPDDQQSMIRLLMYSNEFLICGLIASASGTPGELKEKSTRPDLIRQLIDAYEKCFPQLSQHRRAYPTSEYLRERVKTGNPERGLEAVGQHHDTEGSKWIIECINSANEIDKLNIAIWGGQTDLAQALWRIRTDYGTVGLTSAVAKLRIFDIADQDNLAIWIQSQFPGLFYILSKAPNGLDRRQATFRGMYLTGNEELTSLQWVQQNIISSGPLGNLYPTRTWTAPNANSCMKEGDTPSWFFFLPLGGNDPNDPTHPGWGGSYLLGEDGWYHDLPQEDHPRETISRWRKDFQADFAARLSWCREN